MPTKTIKLSSVSIVIGPSATLQLLYQITISRLTNPPPLRYRSFSWRRHGIITGTSMGIIRCHSGAVSVSVSNRYLKKSNGPLDQPAGFLLSGRGVEPQWN
jgi:hypothetical protein